MKISSGSSGKTITRNWLIVMVCLGFPIFTDACQRFSSFSEPGNAGIAYKKPDQHRDFLQDTWKPRTFSCPPNPLTINWTNGISTHKVTINLLDTLAPVLLTQFGLNTTFRSGSDMVSKRMDNYRNSNMGAYRFPAGSGSNLYFWDGKIPSKFLTKVNPIDGTDKDALKIKDFVTLVHSLDAEATIVVNYFYARYGVTSSGTREERVSQAAKYAAGFVHQANNILKAGIRNWEIGNECYGKWETGYDVNGNVVTGKEYGEDFRVFAAEMKAADPSIKVGAVMYPKDENWNDQVIREVKEAADFLVVHNYFTEFEQATPEKIWEATPQIDAIKKQMEACVTRNTNYPGDHFPVFMTEYNCRGPHTTTFVNACFTADVLGRIIASRYSLATRWVGEWPWKTGTHGLFAVEDPDQQDYTVRQAYLVYHYFGKAFGDYMVKSLCSDDRMAVHASLFSDGKTGLIVINPTGQEMDFNLDFMTGKSGKAWLYEIYANSIAETDKKFYVNGQTSATRGGGPANFTDIPPYESDFQTETLFKVRKYSVSFFVFD